MCGSELTRRCVLPNGNLPAPPRLPLPSPPAGGLSKRGLWRLRSAGGSGRSAGGCPSPAGRLNKRSPHLPDSNVKCQQRRGALCADGFSGDGAGSGESEPERAFLFAVIAPNYHWPAGRRQRLENMKLKGRREGGERERERNTKPPNYCRCL